MSNGKEVKELTGCRAETGFYTVGKILFTSIVAQAIIIFTETKFVCLAILQPQWGGG